MNDMRKLINLMEGVMAVPGLNEARFQNVSCSQCGRGFGPGDSGYSHCSDHKGKTPVDEATELHEKSTSEKQARFMAAAAHDPKFAKKAGIDSGVAKEFNKADTGTKQLSNAMKNVNEGTESEMQTAGTVGRDQADSEFDASQGNAEEVDESQVSDGQMSNPAPAVEVLAMEGSDYDLDFIASSIRNNYDMATSEEELKKMVAGETGYGHNPDFDNMFHGALDHFLNGDDSGMGDLDDGMDGDFDSAMASAGHGSDEDYGGDDFPMEEDLNNGYDSVEVATGSDFFPNGADSPVVKATGPSGARQGDNPEQKKMQVAEVHKELVYGYRNFLKESASSKPKKGEKPKKAEKAKKGEDAKKPVKAKKGHKPNLKK